MRKSTKVKKTKVSKPVASTRILKKFTNGGGSNKLKDFTDPGLEGYPGPEYGDTEPKIYLKPKTALEAAKDLKINPPKATAQTLEEQTASSQDLMKGLMRPPKKEVAVTPTKVSTPKSVATKSPKTVSDSYKKSLQGLMDKGKSIDELVKDGYGTKQGLTNLGLTAPKKATTTKPTTTKPTTPKKATAPIKSSGLTKSFGTKTYRTKEGKVVSEKLIIKKGNPILTRTVQGLEKGKKSTYVKSGDNVYYKATPGSKVTKLNKEKISKGSISEKNRSISAYNKKKELGNEGLATGAVQAVDEFWGIGGPGSKLASSGLKKLGSAGIKLIGKRGRKKAEEAASKILKEQAKKSFDNVVGLTKDKLGKEFAKKTFEKSAKDLAKNAASNTIKASKDEVRQDISKKVFEKSTKDFFKNAVSKDIAKRTTKKAAESTKKDLAESFAKKLADRKAKELAKDASKKGAQKLLGPAKGSKEALGEGIESVAKIGSKALKPDKIIRKTTKALNPGRKITINTTGRTVSSGGQKALNSGQKLLNNGQTKLNAGQKFLQQGSKVSKTTAAKVNKVAKSRSLARNTRNAKLELGIKTNNKVARSMRLKDETANLVKKGTQRVRTSVKNSKIKNAKPKPGDQLKLNLRRGGKK